MMRHHLRAATEQTMNAKVSAKARTKVGQVLTVVGVAAALMAGATSAFAEPHGGGGGGHFSGGGHVSASHFAGRPGGGHYAAAPHSYGGYAGARGYAYSGGRAYAYRGAYGYGYRPGWGGGYWHGAFWPSAYYGWSYPFYLAALPALYATYWWGGVPYYYVNNVYYTYNTADNGYMATDPPPAAGDYSDDVNAAAAAGPDAAAQNATPQDVAPTAAASGLIAYPRNGQSEQQQSQDKFECHNWAKGQTGFDPTSQSSSGAGPGTRDAYGRAMAACLDARGYTVR
jgi:hypothetical protein